LRQRAARARFTFTISRAELRRIRSSNSRVDDSRVFFFGFLLFFSRLLQLNRDRNAKERVEEVLFHPAKPFFFVATQRRVRVYDLVEQKLLKKLQGGLEWISSIDIHPGGDNVIVGSYDRRVCWFDLDLRNTRECLRARSFQRKSADSVLSVQNSAVPQARRAQSRVPQEASFVRVMLR
jgi:WD40 repeat protein